MIFGVTAGRIIGLKEENQFNTHACMCVYMCMCSRYYKVLLWKLKRKRVNSQELSKRKLYRTLLRIIVSPFILYCGPFFFFLLERTRLSLFRIPPVFPSFFWFRLRFFFFFAPPLHLRFFVLFLSFSYYLASLKETLTLTSPNLVLFRNQTRLWKDKIKHK